MEKLLSYFKFFILFPLLLSSTKVFSHAVQLAYGVGCTGQLRLWVEHWHGNESPSTTTMTIIFNGNTITSAPGGAVYGTPLSSLPGSPVSFAACGQANSYNDWVYYNFNVPCGTVFTLTVVSGNTVFTQDNCGMMPATISGTVPCIPLTVATLGASMCPGGSANLSAVAGGFPGGTFVWNPGGIQGDNITVNPIGTTTYTVTYTSPDGCTKTATATVTVLPVPTVIVTSVSICQGYSGTLTATGTPPGGTFLWSPGGSTSNTMTDSPTQTDTYTVTYTAPNGCTKTATGTITVKPDPQPFITNVSPIICLGQGAQLIATSGFPPPANYSWSPGGSTSSVITVFPITTTTYTVTITMNGCVATETATVTVEDPPTVTIAPISICQGSSGTLTAIPSIAGGTYSWAPGGATTPSIAVSPAFNTTYTVTYTSPAGCTGTGIGTVSVKVKPTVTVNSLTICSGTNTTLIATPSTGAGSYSWSPGGGTGQTQSVSPGSTTTYTVTYTLNGCSNTGTGMVTVNPSPTVTATSATVCSGTAATISATPSVGGGAYSWTPGGGTTQSISVTPGTTTTYTVTYTLSGCSATATGTVNVNPMPTVTVNPASVCNGTAALLTATPSLTGGSYFWAPGGATSQSISVTPGVATTYTVTYTLNGCTTTSTGLVTINIVPTVAATSATICNGTAASLSAAPSPGGGTYVWSPGGGTGASVSVSPTTTTTYTVTYTLNGCSGTATGTVNVNPSPTVTASSVTICSGAVATITASPSPVGGSFLWAPSGATGASDNVSPTATIATTTTTYTVNYTFNGCSATATSIVTVNPVPTVSINSSTICQGASGTLTATPSIAGGTYSWAPGGATTASITDAPASTTTYTVTYTLNGCSNTATGTITVNPVPTVAVNSVTVCNGTAANLTATTSIGGGTYTWSPGGGTGQTQTVAPGSTTTYSVTYTLNGCSNTGTGVVTVDLIPTVAVNSVSVCNGATATIAATPAIAGGTYSWAPGGGAGASISVSPGATTTYTVTYTLNGCSGTATGVVTIDPVPTVTVSSTNICNGGSATITATPSIAGGTYLWSPGGGTGASITISPGTTTTYTVTYTSLAGCTNTGTGTVTVGQIPTVAVNSVTVCNGTSATLTATPSVGGGTYLWAPTGGTNSSLTDTPSSTTTYTVTYNLNGCSSTGTGTITVDPVPTVTASSATVCAGTAATLTATPSATGGTYIWTPGGGTNVTMTDAPAVTTTFTVTYTLNGCSNTATGTIIVNPIPTVTVPPATVCNGIAATLTATPSIGSGTYLWAPGGATTASIIVTPAATTTYTVTYTLNGCLNTATALVTVNSIPNVTSTSATVCNGTSATLTAAPSATGGTYLWTPTGGTNSTLTDAPATTTTYTVTYTLNGCSNTATGTITVNPVPTVVVNSATVCNGLSATLTATPSIIGGTYIWSPSGSTTISISDAPATTTTYTVTYTLNGCSNTATGTITVNPVPTVAVNSATVCAGTAATLSATPSIIGGTYSWIPGGQATASITDAPAATTTFTVTYTLNGCSATGTAVITVNPIPSVTATSAAVCAGIAGTITAIPSAAGGNYLWAPTGATTASLIDAPGITTTYTVSYTLNGCSASGTGTITVNPYPTVVVNSATICNGSSATLTAIPSIAGGSYAWNIFGGATSSTISVAPTVTTNYSVIYTVSGCAGTGSGTVTVNPIPAATVNSVSVCNGASGTLTATTTIAGGTYLWTPGGGTTASITVAPASTTTYTVSYSASNCVTTASGTITVNPVPTVTANSLTICDGQSAILSATPSITGGTYLWTPGGGATASISVTPATTTTYTVSYSLNGCSGTGSGTVVVLPGLNLAAAGTATICVGSSTPLSSTAGAGNGGPYTYLWAPAAGLNNPNINNPIATPLVTTTYTVTVTDGCSNPITATVAVTLAPLPNPVFTADVTSGCAPLCVNFTDVSTISSGTITGWTWNFGDGNSSTSQNPQHCYDAAGAYTVSLTITSANSCSSTVTYTNFINVYPVPVADFTMPTTASALNSIVPFTDLSSGASIWSWNFGEPLSGLNDTSTLQNPYHTYLDPGTYCITLAVQNRYGCVDTTERCLQIEPEFTFYIPNAFSPNNDGKNDVFMGKGENIIDYEMFIFDRWGNQIFKTENLAVGWDGKANGGDKKAQIDVYVYVVNLVDFRGGEHTYRGTVTIVK